VLGPMLTDYNNTLFRAFLPAKSNHPPLFAFPRVTLLISYFDCHAAFLVAFKFLSVRSVVVWSSANIVESKLCCVCRRLCKRL
jgi:hypothetical protein